jgi:hypothetical protein
MKTCVVIAVLVAMLGMPHVCAQSLVMESDIPFAFQVGSKVLPAGQYSLSKLTICGSWLIRDRDQSNYGAVNTFQLAYGDTGKHKLVFHRYGNDYFLREISTPLGTLGVPKSAQEASVQIRAGSPLPVIVAATFRRR